VKQIDFGSGQPVEATSGGKKPDSGESVYQALDGTQ
jgi:hypothetical protein